MRFVLVSDTHGLHDRMPPVPDGDVLVHAGDLTMRGTLAELGAALRWVGALPHRHKVVVAGNHDFAFERQAGAAEGLVPDGVTYLRDARVTLDGPGRRRVRVWGSPWQPWFHGWAFNLRRGERLARVWAQVPDDTEVLVTHTPPVGILDRVAHGGGLHGTAHVGCEDLRARVDALGDLRLHAFGHIHEDHGAVEQGGRRFVNASTCTAGYAPANAPVVADL